MLRNKLNPLAGTRSRVPGTVQACRADNQVSGGSLVAGLEEEGVNDEDGVHMCSSLAGLNQGRVVMQAETLQALKTGQERVLLWCAWW